MTSLVRSYPDDLRLHRQGWVCSLVFHVVMGTGALTIVAGLTPSFESDSFKWNVALVESPKPQPAVDPLPEVKPEPDPIPPKPKVAESRPAPVEPVVEPVQQRVVQQPAQVVQRQVTQAVQATTEIIPVNQTASTVIAQAVQHHEVSQAAAPVMTPEAVVQKEQATTAQETVAAVVTEPVISSQTVDAASQHPATEIRESTAPAQQPAVESMVAHAASSKVVPAAKADYGWLMKALLGRVNELKNYPHTARMNHWEGKVVLRAVIKDDGQVLMVDVQESSGRSILDNDAMETLRKASPLKLEHPLGKPQVAILMPISYSLR
ncbi:MAG TPA: TonB family protein [Nitrospira sp.]|nr:TonB family protein [Nitrospira sp.]